MKIKKNLFIKNSYLKKKNNNYIFLKKKTFFKYIKKRRILKKKRYIFLKTDIKSLFLFHIFINRSRFFKKLISYFNYIKKLKYILKKKNNNIFIFSHFVYLGGFSYTLLKDFFIKENFDYLSSFNNWIFEPFKLDKFFQNSIYLYKKNTFYLKNKLFLSINNNLKMFEIFNICKYLLNLTLIPYNFIPIAFFSSNLNTLVMSSLYLNFYCYDMELIKINNFSLLNNMFILQLKMLIVFFFIVIIHLYKKLIIKIFN